MSKWAEWTDDDEALLSRLWEAGTPVKYIAAALKREERAVYVKSHRMRLPRRVPVVAKDVVERELVALTELDTIPMPKRERAALSTLLESYPTPIRAADLAKAAGEDLDRHADNPSRRGMLVAAAVSRRLSPFGWQCGGRGDRKGVYLYPAQEGRP